MFYIVDDQIILDIKKVYYTFSAFLFFHFLINLLIGYHIKASIRRTKESRMPKTAPMVPVPNPGPIYASATTGNNKKKRIKGCITSYLHTLLLSFSIVPDICFSDKYLDHESNAK